MIKLNTGENIEKDYMYKNIDPTVKDFAMEADSLKSEMELQRQQEMMYKNIENENDIESTERHR